MGREACVADNDSGVFVLGKKAFITTVIAIALNPIGIAVGYAVGKWLQAPKLTVQTVTIEAETEGVTLTKDLVPILQNLENTPGVAAESWRYTLDDRDK